MKKTADYRKAVEKAIEVLEDADISQAPVELDQIIERFSGEIKVVPYSALTRKCGLSKEELVSIFDSDMGTSAYEPATNHYIIYYNDTLSIEWSRFTISHELGHIFLGHHTDVNFSVQNSSFLSKHQYDIYEREANVFSRNLLSPAPLAVKVMSSSDDDYTVWADLQYAFAITERASVVRLSFLQQDLKSYSETMTSFVNTIRIRYHRTCPYCMTIVPRHAKFCITCGVRSNFKAINNHPLPVFVPFNQNGVFVHCVRCGNTENTPEARYCKICGAPLSNLCIGNLDPSIGRAHINPSNALFCGTCGSPTCFKLHNITPKEVQSMTYQDGVAYDKETMRVKICPVCKNEEFSNDAEFCRICGTGLYNRCEGITTKDSANRHMHINPSNARFCETCGKETYFYKTGILGSYKQYQGGCLSVDSEPSHTSDFITDQELPFN